MNIMYSLMVATALLLEHHVCRHSHVQASTHPSFSFRPLLLQTKVLDLFYQPMWTLELNLQGNISPCYARRFWTVPLHNRKKRGRIRSESLWSSFKSQKLLPFISSLLTVKRTGPELSCKIHTLGQLM